jgi:hypothetical protein
MLPAPGIMTPVRPVSAGNGCFSQNNGIANCQKSDFPTDVILIDPAGSATAS